MELHKRLLIRFKGEEGIDYGGIARWGGKGKGGERGVERGVRGGMGNKSE